MPGLVPASVPPGKIGWLNQTPQTVTPAGLTLVPGSGLLGSTDTTLGRLQLDASRTSPPETFSLFTPGLCANGQTLGVWKNTRASQLAPVLALEVNIKTPGTGTTTDFFGVKLTDSNGTNIQLPLKSTAAHFALNGGDGAVIAQSWVPTVGSVTSSDFGHVGLAQSFVPTQQLVVTGVSAPVGWKGFGSVAVAGPMACRILDGTTYAELIRADITTGTTWGGLAYFGFAKAVTLAQNKTYVLVFDAFDYSRPLGSGNDYGMVRWALSGSAQSAPLTSIGTATAGYVNDDDNAGGVTIPTADTWPSFLSPTGNNHALYTTLAEDLFGSGAALLGSGGLGLLKGDVTASIYITGAPTVGPTDLNMRVLFGGSS